MKKAPYEIHSVPTEEGAAVQFPVVDSDGVGLIQLRRNGEHIMGITFEIQGKTVCFALDQHDCQNIVDVLTLEIPLMSQANKKGAN